MFPDNKKHTRFLVDSLAASSWFCVLPSPLIPFALLPISVTTVSASTWHWQQGCVPDLNHRVKRCLFLKRTQRQTVGPQGAAVQPVCLYRKSGRCSGPSAWGITAQHEWRQDWSWLCQHSWQGLLPGSTAWLSVADGRCNNGLKK